MKNVLFLGASLLMIPRLGFAYDIKYQIGWKPGGKENALEWASMKCRLLFGNSASSTQLGETLTNRPGKEPIAIYIGTFRCHFPGTNEELVPHLIEAMLHARDSGTGRNSDIYQRAIEELVALENLSIESLLDALQQFDDFRAIGATEALGKIKAVSDKVYFGLILAMQRHTPERLVEYFAGRATRDILERGALPSPQARTELRRVSLQMLGNSTLGDSDRAPAAGIIGIVAEKADLPELRRIRKMLKGESAPHFLIDPLDTVIEKLRQDLKYLV